MTKKKRLTVVCPDELLAEIEHMRAALGNRCGFEPSMSSFLVATIRRGLGDMKKEPHHGQ